MLSGIVFPRAMLPLAMLMILWPMVTASSAQCGDNSSCTGSSCCNPPPPRCGIRAPEYPVPYPTPSWVGYTSFTYPPLMPHHSLPHYRNIYSYRHGAGLSRTNVWWHKSYLGSTRRWLHHLIELPR